MPTCPEGHGDEGSEAGHGVENDPVHQEANRQGEQEQVPEPEEQEELLVDDVVGKDTYGLTTISTDSNDDNMIVCRYLCCLLISCPSDTVKCT